MPLSRVLFSSKKQDWPTPDSFFNQLDAEFSFVLDAAADAINTKCSQFYTEEDDAFGFAWNVTTFINPPYCQAEAVCKPNCKKKRCVEGKEPRGHVVSKPIPGIYKWFEKAREDSLKYGSTIVMLVPSRTGSKWFHAFCVPILYGKMPGEVRFVKGRIKFTGATAGAAFDSLVVVFRPH